MVGGDAATLDRVRPALEPVAARVVHVGGPGMGQVVKLCNNLIYAAQMVATAEAAALARRSGADLAKLHEVLVHATGDCVAVRTRFPVAGVVRRQPGVERLGARVHDRPDGQGPRPGHSPTAPARACPWPSPPPPARPSPPAPTAGYGREDFSAVAKVIASPSGLPEEESV